MTECGGKPDTRQNGTALSFMSGIEVDGRRAPSPKELDEADRVFNRILKNRKQ
jgi:hypothetical protein